MLFFFWFRVRGTALCPLSLAGIIGAAVPALSPSPSSRLRNGGAALCPLSFATRYRLRRCVARLLVMFDCRVMGFRRRYGALPPLVHSPPPSKAERSSLTPPRPSASRPDPVYRCQFRGRATPYPQPVTSLRRPLFCSCSGRHCLHPLPDSFSCSCCRMAQVSGGVVGTNRASARYHPSSFHVDCRV